MHGPVLNLKTAILGTSGIFLGVNHNGITADWNKKVVQAIGVDPFKRSQLWDDGFQQCWRSVDESWPKKLTGYKRRDRSRS